MKKLAVIINGAGGVGKDTLCDIAAKHYRVCNRSSITPIKEIAAQHGWQGEKTLAARRFLADLKAAFILYNDLPNTYLAAEYQAFLAGNDQILFMHVRECEQITALKERLGGSCVTLLVRRRGDDLAAHYGNHADDDVEAYAYDAVYDNSCSLEETEKLFPPFLNELFKKYGTES